jgi:hypothetical protein
VSIPVLSREGGTNNPLVVLNNHLEQITAQLSVIARHTAPDATAILPHIYALVQAHDDTHGAVWGSVCVACTDSTGSFIYPCNIEPDVPVKPPRFFTIGDVFDVDKHGRMVRIEHPKSS